MHKLFQVDINLDQQRLPSFRRELMRERGEVLADMSAESVPRCSKQVARGSQSVAAPCAVREPRIYIRNAEFRVGTEFCAEMEFRAETAFL